MYTLLMRVGLYAVTLTLVGMRTVRARANASLLVLALTQVFSTSVAFAAPETPDPDLSVQSAAESEPGDKRKLELLEVTEPKGPLPTQSGVVKRARDIFYPYQSSVSPRAGAGVSSRKVSNENAFYFVGLSYMLDSPHSRHHEFGIDLTSQSHGLFHAAYKWVFDHNSAFRPHLKFGTTVMLVPSEQLGTFLKASNYQLRGAAGFEKLLKAPMSLRCDLEAAWISGGYAAAFSLGYSWAW